jgi:tetratricopeptide (TPR) repeat protein
MKLFSLSFLLSVFFAGMLSSIAVAQPSGGTELNLGVQAYQQAKYEQAIQHFEKAIELDTENTAARFYLATAYAQQYIPGADQPANNALAEHAIEQYKKVIDVDFSKGTTTSAVKGIAYLELQMKNFDEAKEYYRRATELDPDDAEPYYSVGVIDWTLSYEARHDERAKLNLKRDASLPATNSKVCAMLREKNWATIAEGIDYLKKAIKLRADFDDAMAYMNLMYRERADVQCDDSAARESDLRTADDWVDKTMASKKVKAEKEKTPLSPVR